MLVTSATKVGRVSRGAYVAELRPQPPLTTHDHGPWPTTRTRLTPHDRRPTPDGRQPTTDERRPTTAHDTRPTLVGVVGCGSSVVGRRSSVVGRESWVVGGRRSSVVDEVVGRRSWVVGRASLVGVVGSEQRLVSVALLTGGSCAEAPREQLSLSLLPGTPVIIYRLRRRHSYFIFYV